MKKLIILIVLVSAAAAVWALGPVPGTDNYMNILMTSGGPRVNVAGANFHVEGTTLLDSTLQVTGASAFTGAVTLPAGTALPGSSTITTPTITTPVISGLLTNTPQAFSIADDGACLFPALVTSRTAMSA